MQNAQIVCSSHLQSAAGLSGSLAPPSTATTHVDSAGTAGKRTLRIDPSLRFSTCDLRLRSAATCSWSCLSYTWRWRRSRRAQALHVLGRRRVDALMTASDRVVVCARGPMCRGIPGGKPPSLPSNRFLTSEDTSEGCHFVRTKRAVTTSYRMPQGVGFGRPRQCGWVEPFRHTSKHELYLRTHAPKIGVR